jgi:probable rRNA maturation factor
MTIEIQNEYDFVISEDRLRAAAQTVIAQHQNHVDYPAAADSALTIVITENQAVADLNRSYRGIDAPTDVLSFPADEPPVELADEPPYLGDLIIAYPYAKAQAERESHALDDSLALLVVHGTLHLLGYDHDKAEAKAVMWAAQEQALIALGISPEIVPALEAGDDGH